MLDEKIFLAISKEDLIELGIPKGDILDDILGMLIELIKNGEIENVKGNLLERAKEIVRMAI